MTDGTATTAETLRAEIAALESEIDRLHREAVRHDQELTALQDRAASLDYGPSEYKYLSTQPNYIRTSYRRFAQFWRNLALTAEIRGGVAGHHPPARDLSAGLRQAFAMQGRIPVLDAYFAASHPPADDVCFTAEQVAALRHGFGSAAADAGPSPSYSRAVAPLLETTDPLVPAITAHVRAGMTVAVCGSIAPVYESLCLNADAVPTALGFAAVRSESPLIATAGFADAVRDGRRFDVVIAGWLVAQAGMGLHDTVDPDGDLALMNQLGALTAPGGLLISGLPIGPDLAAYNSGRIYGPLRLPLVLQGFEEIDRIDARPAPGGDPADTPSLVAFVLQRRPETVAGDAHVR